MHTYIPRAGPFKFHCLWKIPFETSISSGWLLAGFITKEISFCALLHNFSLEGRIFTGVGHPLGNPQSYPDEIVEDSPILFIHHLSSAITWMQLLLNDGVTDSMAFLKFSLAKYVVTLNKFSVLFFHQNSINGCLFYPLY